MSPALRVRNWFVLIGLLCAFPTLIFGQAALTKSGGEYEISGPLNGDQTAPAVAISAAGGWTLWQDPGIDGRGLGIGARRLDNNLNPLGSPFVFSKITAGDQEKPGVASLNNGGAVGAWQGGRQGFQNIYARFLRADGSFATDDVLVNEPAFTSNFRQTTNWMVIRNNHVRFRTQRIKGYVSLKRERTSGAVVAALNDGTVVVAYASARKSSTNLQAIVHPFRYNGLRFITNSVLQFAASASADTMQDVYFQLFTPAGQKIGGEIRANQYLPFNQSSPAIAALSDGSFVLAWASDRHPANPGVTNGSPTIDIVARRFDHTGVPLGDEFVVNTANRPCGEPAVAASASGGFTVAWTQRDPVTRLDVRARAFNSSAAPLADSFLVNAEVRGDQHTPRLTAAPGGQLVVWTSVGQDTSREGVYGRRLNDGALVGDEFRVNTTTHLRQFAPAVAGDASRALVIWSSYQTDAGFDLFGQRYAP